MFVSNWPGIAILVGIKGVFIRFVGHPAFLPCAHGPFTAIALAVFGFEARRSLSGSPLPTSVFPASKQYRTTPMRPLWHSLLTAVAFILAAVAPIAPHPFERLIAAVVQLCLFPAELLK